jgi:hypothetical protein
MVFQNVILMPKIPELGPPERPEPTKPGQVVDALPEPVGTLGGGRELEGNDQH